MLPGTILYVYLGSAVKNLADLAAGRIEGGLAQRVSSFVGLLATLIVTVFITRIAKKALDSAVAHHPVAPKPDSGPAASTTAQGATHG